MLPICPFLVLVWREKRVAVRLVPTATANGDLLLRDQLE